VRDEGGNILIYSEDWERGSVAAGGTRAAVDFSANNPLSGLLLEALRQFNRSLDRSSRALSKPAMSRARTWRSSTASPTIKWIDCRRFQPISSAGTSVVRSVHNGLSNGPFMVAPMDPSPLGGEEK
jgi:hypothetical protein